MSDDLAPYEGQNKTVFRFEGLQRISREHGHAEIQFSLSTTDTDDGEPAQIARLGFICLAKEDGIDGMVARGHDQLIDMLRQAIFKLDKDRAQYRVKAAKISAP